MLAVYGAIWLIALGAWVLVARVLRKRMRAPAYGDARFRELFDSAPVAYHELDREGVIRQAAAYDACLVKPVREAALREGIQRVLDRRESAAVHPAIHPDAHTMLTRRPSPRSMAPPPAEALSGSAWRILLVEDNTVNRKLGTALLGKLGRRVDVAANGRQALEVAARFPYDMILTDCQMPVMDGFEATGEIRGCEGTARHTPIVALTAAVMAEDRRRCARAGMDDYVAKPVTLAALGAALNRWLGEPGAQKSGLAERSAGTAGR
jgi:CheY-like chemotaxis protein